MEIGILLEKLIDIAQISKTDFALSMNMTPSGLSKILTGKRLPLAQEKERFCKQAAAYLAETIYCIGCCKKFAHIFPVIYDFDSKYELEIFLSYALEYFWDKDLCQKNNVDLEYPEKGVSYLGKRIILNMFCLILSESLTNDSSRIHKERVPLEFYSTLPLFNRLYSDIFHRIKILDEKKQRDISFHHFFSLPFSEEIRETKNITLLSSLAKAQQYVDLNLWKTAAPIDSSFLLLKGQFLLLFSIQIDGTPLMIVVTHKSYLITYFNCLMKKGAKKISYNRSEAIAALEANPCFADKLTSQPIDAVYNFISIGYLVEKGELEKNGCKKIIQDILLKVFHNILSKETNFFVTLGAMVNIYTTGKAVVPLLGTIRFEPEERVSYLRRFDSYITKDNHDKIKIINRELPKMAVICTPGLSLVYLIDPEDDSEKFHYFETDAINKTLEYEVSENGMALFDFSSDLWDTYLDNVSKILKTEEIRE